MNLKQLERLHRPQPALVVKYGNAEKKYLPLDRTGITLGRARGCDIELDSQEVSAVHCIITREGSGLNLRDCNSRGGTRVNGSLIHEAPLHDGDVVHIGPFSFEVQLPGVYVPPPVPGEAESTGKVRLPHLVQSRRGLARLALALRRRLREQRGAQGEGETQHALNRLKADLEIQAEALRNRVRHFEQKSLQMEEAERRLAADRETLTREAASFQDQVRQDEGELEERRIRIEAEYQAREKEWEQRCHSGEGSLSETAEGIASQAALAEETRRLDLRRQELDCYARHLQRAWNRLQQQVPIHELICFETIVQMEAALREPRAELDGLVQEFKRLHQDSLRQQEALQVEVAAWRREVSPNNPVVLKLRGRAATSTPSPAKEGTGAMEEELEKRCRRLEEERQQLQQELHQVQARKVELDEAVREAEVGLSQERAQLFQERAHLNQMRAEVQLAWERAHREPSLRGRLIAGAERKLD